METRSAVTLEQCEQVPVVLMHSVKDFMYTEASVVNDNLLVLSNASDHNNQMQLLDTNIESLETPENLSDLCRVCSNASNHMIPIFEEEGIQHSLGIKIHKHLPITVSELDTLPLQLCYHCAATLLAWHDLREGCQAAEQKLLLMQSELQRKHQQEKDNEKLIKNITFQSPAEIQETTKIKPKVELLNQAQVRCGSEESSEIAANGDKNETEDEINSERSGFGDFQKAYTAFLSSSRLKKPRILKRVLNYHTPTSQVSEIDENIPPAKCTTKENHEPPDDRIPTTIENQEPAEKTNDKNPYSCALCGKYFCDNEMYQAHMRIHSREKHFTCHVCGKQFGQTGSLYYHLRHVHGGVKNHSCDLCGRSFAMKTAMEDHRRIHTGERPYVCDSCGKTFKTKASLYIHGKTHTDQYRFPCTHCKKAFRWNQQLIAHLTIHTGVKDHTCDVCGKSFGVKYGLTRHRRIHSAEKPFICDQCGLSFGQKRYLRNHERTRHK